MKKMIRILSLLLSVWVIFSLVSCDFGGKDKETLTVTEEKPFVPGDAASLWKKIDDTMNEIDSYEMDQVLEMTYYYLGNKIETVVTLTGIRSTDEENFYVYTEGKSEMVCEALSMEETAEMKEAWYEGKMYLYNKTPEFEQKFCSPMTAEEYREREDESVAEDVDFNDCTRSEFSKNEDGTWLLTFSGYTKKAIKALTDNADLSGDMLGADVLDMDVTISADENFRATGMEIQFSFDLEEDATIAPVFHQKTDFRKFDEAEFDSSKIIPEEYTEVEDLYILDDVKQGIEDIQNATSGKFTLTTKTDVTAMSRTTTSNEVDVVTYGEENGSYHYDIQANVNGEKMSISYQGGVQTITMDGVSENYSMTEEEAKTTVDELIDSASYDKLSISSLEKLGEGVYLLKSSMNPETLTDGMLSDEEIQYNSMSEEITVTMKDDAIEKMEIKSIITGTFLNGTKTENITVVIEATLEFEKIEKTKVA